MAALQVVVSIVQYLLFPQRHVRRSAPVRASCSATNGCWRCWWSASARRCRRSCCFAAFCCRRWRARGWASGGAALITTSLWTALHAGYSLAGIVEVFLIGLFFSWLLWRTGSLRVAIFCHALYNSLIVVVLRYVPLPA